MFHSIADGFSESYSISSDSSGTDVVLVFVDVVLSVVVGVNVRDVIDAGTDRSLIDLSRYLDIPFIWVATWIILLQAT